MKNMNKLFLMSALLLAASSTSYAAMTLKLVNDSSEVRTARFSQALADGRKEIAFTVNGNETVVVAESCKDTDFGVTWSWITEKGVEYTNSDTVRFTNATQELKSSSDDDQGDGDADKLS